MFSIGQLLVLKPGCEQEYKRRHDELWPDLADAMRRAGVNMAIYLHGNHLFLFATAESKSLWDELDRAPVTPLWDAYMSDILLSDDNGKPLVTELPLMFGFGEFGR